MSPSEHDILANRIARYGLPLLVLIFYLHAARFLEFSPDEAFVVPTHAAGLIEGVGLAGPSWDGDQTTPAPLWVLLVAAGGALGIDLVLTAKIFGLFFASLAVLATYLLAVEMLDDRIAALCVALIMATAPWLTMVSAAGDGLTLALALTLTALFFHVRGDLLLGVLLAALAGLVLWPAMLLGILIIIDDLRRAPAGSERRRRGTTSGLLLVSLLVFWGLIAARLGAGVLPGPPGTLMALDPVTMGGVALLAGTGLGVILVAVGKGRIIVGRRSMLPLALVWGVTAVLAGAVSGSNAVLLAVPVLLMIGFLGLAILAVFRRSGGGFRLGAVFGVTAVLLLANQVALYTRAGPTMRGAGAEFAQLESAASWVRTAVPAGRSISSDRPWTLSYLTGDPVRPYRRADRPDVVVLTRGEPAGYSRAFRAPVELDPAGIQVFGEVSVWTHTGEPE